MNQTSTVHIGLAVKPPIKTIRLEHTLRQVVLYCKRLYSGFLTNRRIPQAGIPATVNSAMSIENVVTAISRFQCDS